MATLLTLNSIMKEMRDIPVDRLEDLYSFVHSLNPKTKKSDNLRRMILAFAGSFCDMTSRDYSEFIKDTRKTRAKLFDRTNDL